MSELVTRALTGAAYVALTLGAAWAGPWTTALLFAPACAIGARELHRLYWNEQEAPPVGLSMTIAVLAYAAIAGVALVPGWSVAAAAVTLAGLLVAASIVLMRAGPPTPAAAFGGIALIIGYIALPFALTPHMLANGPFPLIGFFLLLWMNDTGAYLVGRAIGRTKLMPTVSPKKTIEGLVGGILLTMGVAWWLAGGFTAVAPLDWVVCAGIVGLTGTVGDLLESAFKRARGVKDSGRVLPGHGGILDRFDGFLIALPAVYAWLYMPR